MAHLYSLPDVFSLVSEVGKGMGEGIPLTPLEAMACGTPIIVGDEDGSKQIKGDITVQIEPNVMVKGDDFILRMVINNLIENAFKYSNNQPIEVSLETEAKWKKLSIKDRGIGLKKEDFKNIFKKFYRVQDEETRISKGTGLGLFIVKQAVERHSGKVFVKANEDKGVTFTILLP